MVTKIKQPPVPAVRLPSNPEPASSTKNPVIGSAPADTAGVNNYAPGDEGAIHIDGREIPRAAPPLHPASNQGAVEQFFSAFTAQSADPAHTDWTTQAQADKALDSKNRPTTGKRLGKLAVFVPGAGNVMFSPADVLRAAKYYADKVVLAYNNTTNPAKNTLHQIHEIIPGPGQAPVRIPKGLHVYAIGDERRSFGTWEQGSDALLEQLSAIAHGLHKDPAKLHATILAHSQGALATSSARERLNTAHLGGAVHKVISVAGALDGGALIDNPAVGQAWIDGAGKADGLQGADSMAHLSTKYVTGKVGQKQYDQIDAAYVGSVSLGQKNPDVRKAMVDLNGLMPGGVMSDGVVDNPGGLHTRAGGVQVNMSKALDKGLDHVGMSEDTAVLDKIVETAGE